MTVARPIIVSALLLLAAGCTSSDLSGPGETTRRLLFGGVDPITTDSGSYTLQPDWVGLKTTIRIRFQNQSNRTMYIVNCGGALAPMLQQQTSRGWVNAWGPVLYDCLSPPIVVQAGAVLERDILVWGALPGHNMAPSWPSADVAGTYRLVLGNIVWNYTDRGPSYGEAVPHGLRVSNEFELRR